MKHDASRVLQVCNEHDCMKETFSLSLQSVFKYGVEKQKNAVMVELKEKIEELAFSKYGHQLVSINLSSQGNLPTKPIAVYRFKAFCAMEPPVTVKTC